MAFWNRKKPQDGFKFLELPGNGIVRPIAISPTQAMGSSGTTIFSGYFDEEYLADLKGQPAADKYDQMRRNDARVRMCLAAVSNPIRSASWEIQAAQDADENQERQKELVEHILFSDLNKTWQELLSEILSFIAFGHSVFELVDKVVLDHPKFGSYNGLSQIGFRSQRTLWRWNLNKETGKIESLEQTVYGDLDRQVLIPGDRLLVFSLEKEGDNYEGISGLRACYGSWYRKQVYLKLMAIGIERNAVPTPKVKFPPNFPASEQWSQLVANLEALTSHQQNYLLYPNTVEIDFNTNNFDPEKVKEAIKFENEEMSFAFLQNFLLLGQQGSGSYALSFDLSDFYLSGIESVAQLVCDQFNRIVIPKLVKMNFGPQEVYPKLVCSGISDKAGKEFAEMLKLLFDSKGIVPDDKLEENLRKRLGLPEKSAEGQRSSENSNPEGVQFSEHPKKKDYFLAEKVTPKKLIRFSQEKLTAYMRETLKPMGDRLVQDLMRAVRNSIPSQRINAYKQVKLIGGTAYQTELVEWLAEIANVALEKARKEVPKAKGVRLSEDLKLSEFDRLPPDLQRRIKAASELLVGKQVADLEKGVFFKFTANAMSTEGNDAVLEEELQNASDDYIDGVSIVAGASEISATVVNESRNAFFYDSEVLEEIESFTFVNSNPVSEICQDLAGRTFSKDDPSAEMYQPPLHWNCKSYIVPNLKGSNKEIDERGLKPSSEKIASSIQFGELKIKK